MADGAFGRSAAISVDTLALAFSLELGAMAWIGREPCDHLRSNETHGGTNMKKVSLLVVLVAALMGASAARAQDPVKVDPKHYTVMSENDQVRLLHVRYAPGEKSVMHSHPDSVVVFLEDQKAKMTHPDGKSEEMSGKKGDAVFLSAGAHLPENIGTGPIDVILVELKKPAVK
jgi:quercetin dioxygenase-like cupin family protein